MTYLSAKDIAKKWNVAVRRVQAYCAEGKIPGAKMLGNQWIIPSDSKKPLDGRLKEAKNQVIEEEYHFPALVHTKYYAQRDELNELEQMLLDAQILKISGKLLKSIDKCYDILKYKPKAYIKMGVYLTLAFCNMLLRIKSETNRYYDAMKKLADEENSHKGDFKLILAYFDLHFKLNAKAISETDPSVLSADALPLFGYSLLLNDYANTKDTHSDRFPYYEALCVQLKYSGIDTTLLGVHISLSILYMRDLKEDVSLKHLKEACFLAVKYDYLSFLVKGNPTLGNRIESELRTYGSAYAKKYKDLAAHNLSAWSFMFGDTPDKLAIKDIIHEDGEILFLLAYGLKLSEISKLKHIPQKELSEIINRFCKMAGVSSKEELIASYRKTVYSDTNAK